MERIDDLQFAGLKLLQDDTLPCFTADAVALCNFLSAGASDRVVDLGSGTGLLCVLGQGKTGAAFTGVERDAALCRLETRQRDERRDLHRMVGIVGNDLDAVLPQQTLEAPPRQF